MKTLPSEWAKPEETLYVERIVAAGALFGATITQQYKTRRVDVTPGQLRALAAELIEIANDIDDERREREEWRRENGKASR